MKKKKLFLGLSVLAGAVVLASCTVSQDNSTTTSKTNESTTTTTVAEKNYTVTWKNDDGSVIKTDTVKEGTVASYDGATPTKASDAEYSYTFKSWDKELSAVNADVVYTAVYESIKNKYTYTFYDEDGTTELKKETVEYGTQVSAPTSPEKQDTAEDDYTFDGWYDAKTGGNKVTSFSTITGNVSYYARYTSEKNKYTYTFYDENGTSVLGTNNVAYGTQIEVPANPTKAADDDYVYTFAGWYDAKEGGNKVESFGTVSGNVSYYARYTKKAACTITFYNEDGTDVLDTKKIAEGAEIVAPTDPTKQEDDNFAYSFDGWYDAATDGNKVTTFGTASGNASYYARFNNVAKYYVTFYAEDGVTPLDSKKVAEGTQIVAPNNPTKTADAEYIYTFDAWYDAATDGNKVTEFGTVDGPKSYYARFNKALKITVSFVVDGTSYGEPQVIATGSKATKPANPTKTGFDFKYWTLDGTTAFDFNTELTSNTELTAYFEEATDIKEGFGEGFTSWETLVTTAGATTNSDGHYVLSKAVTIGSYSFAIVSDKTRVNKDYAKYVTQGATITITLKSAGTIYLEGNWGSDKKDGYVIIKNGSTEVYKSKKYEHDMSESIAFSQAVPAGTYTISTVDASDSAKSVSIQITKLYFEREANYADVTFSTEYGTAPAPRRLEQGDKLGAIADLYQDGYVFLGWYDAATGGNKVTADTVINETKTIYAQWKVYDPNDYVTISFDETTVGTRTPITKEKGETFSELEDLTKDGYAFKGWYTDASFNTPFNKDASINSNVTLYAKFVKILTITFKYSDDTIIDTLKIEEGESIASSNAPQVKYIPSKTFDHWTTNGTDTFDFENTTITSDLVLTAVYIDRVDTGHVEVITSSGYLESLYAEFLQYGEATEYKAYVKLGTGNYTKLDDQLIRKYKSEDNTYNYYRVDAVGLKAGTYTLKIVPYLNNAEDTDAATEIDNLVVNSYDRSGFAFSDASPLKQANGAYNADGTLRTGAQVIYVTSSNAKTVKATINGKEATGLQGIIAAKQKADSSSEIIDIRILGTIFASDMDAFGSSAEGLQVKGAGARQNMNMTIEGIGNDAGIHGFGILIRNCSNVELRNFAVMNCMDDSISVDTDNCNLWIHNLDMFYGQVGGDSDQAKGDGTIDIKLSQYITVSYNHYWDSGKASLLDAGEKASNYVDNITMHHNWFDHSDSRHPRCRNGKSFHVYNNYYDGVSKYGVGAAGGGTSVFVESNYYRNTKYPMLSSMQGSDVYASGTTKNTNNGTFSGEDGGIIKSYGNYFEGTYTYIPYGCTEYVNKGVRTAYDLAGTTSTVDFDAYEVTSKDQTVPNTVKSFQGNVTYSNFDTASTMYSYVADSPEVAKENVIKYAGRVQGGDLKWTFDNSVQDTNYGVIAELRTALQNYSSRLLSVQSIGEQSSGSGSTDPIPSTSDADSVFALIEALPESTAVTENDRTAINAAKTAYDALDATEQAKVTNYSKLQACIAALPVQTSTGLIHFTGSKVNVTGNIQATNSISSYKTDKGSITYNGVTYSVAAKFDSNPTLTITTTSACTIKLGLCAKSGGKFAVGNEVIALTTTAAEYTLQLEANKTYELKRSDKECYLFYVAIV